MGIELCLSAWEGNGYFLLHSVFSSFFLALFVGFYSVLFL